MEKILVATDLSAHSSPAIHFAYRLSQLKGATLVIVHVYHILKPRSWRSHRFESYHKARKEYLLTKLNKLLDRIVSALGTPIINFEIDLQMNPNVVTTILKCVAKHKCTYMCIGTHGTGNVKQVIGTSASKLIAKAKIPIISVPRSYNLKNLDRICYASDMHNYQKEIRKIIEFVNPYNMEIRLVHVQSPSEALPRATLLESRLYKRTGIVIKVKYVLKNPSNTLIEDIDHAIKKMKPSLVTFFVSRSKKHLSSSFSALDTQHISLFKKTPILIYKK